MHKLKQLRYYVLLMIVIIMILNTRIATAERTVQGNPETLAVALVIDTSGSMAETDPQKLREVAANIFIDLLSPEDYLGIITFNSTEEVILPIVQVQNAEMKNEFKRILSNKLEKTSGDTDYLVALNQASQQLDNVKVGNIQKVIVFLTDGNPDPQGKGTSSEYMGFLWEAVSDLALRKYPVYSVGFSNNLNPEILSKISQNTQGKMKISENPGELALNFFDILGELKNRQSFLENELNGTESLEFSLDKYTSQATMVFTNPSAKEYELKVTPPDENLKSHIHINQSQMYSVVTINQEDKNLGGQWKVDFIGSGSISTFGNKDTYIKPWLMNPKPGSLHPTNEPLEILVEITGENKEKISVEAILSKDGVLDRMTIPLALKDEAYVGTYDKTEEAGKYNIEIRLLQDGKIILTDINSFTLRPLPFITVDYWEEDSRFRLGEEVSISSSLNLGGKKLIQSEEIQIKNYNLVLDYNLSEKGIIPLLDNGSIEDGDILANDGIWSSKFALEREDSGEAYVIVNGIYKGEEFILEKSLGNFTFLPTGKISITPFKKQLFTYNGQVSLPLQISNSSQFSETIELKIDKKLGVVEESKITIKPLSEIDVKVVINLNEGLKKEKVEIPIQITSDNPLLQIENNDIKIEIEWVSRIVHLWRGIKDSLLDVGGLIGLFILSLGFIILLGLIFYRFRVYKNTIVRGELLYKKVGDSLDDMSSMNFNKYRKGRIVISFDENKKDAHYYLKNKEYDYDIEIYIRRQNSKWKFVEGWKDIFKKVKPSEIILKTTEPGIFIYEGKVYTKKKIYDQDRFTSGGYEFEYRIARESKPKDKQKGKNVLEGIS